jgi:hypothetical protein
VLRYKLVNPVGIGALAPTIHVRLDVLNKVKLVNPVGIGALAPTVHVKLDVLNKLKLVNPVGSLFVALIVPPILVSRISKFTMRS